MKDKQGKKIHIFQGQALMKILYYLCLTPGFYSYGLPQKKKQLVGNFATDKPIPCTLASGEGVQAWIESERFVELVKAEGFEKEVQVFEEFFNKAGRVFRSKTETLEIDKLLYAKEKNHITPSPTRTLNTHEKGTLLKN